ncbi:hypothetical protein NEOLEDRAFT_1242342 [Neolentinus lepideus HHB14362 ss-1]|uniref:BZIP domain-containing protein n=1 Tax=Neolentinus lepideus HHB14362 ss-1 TaxID=1314782 RepID=A0A165S542_9AGAM|nr:hypothetical protein NEOLEDRAFT_1242342 [Neolentinus lepideus HHB14362 ss-1]
METFNGIPSLWDLSQQPVSFSQLPDDDFLALLQKQFVSNDSHSSSPTTNSSLFSLNSLTSPLDSVDPQSLTRYSSTNGISGSPSSSDESSPSPPSFSTDPSSRRQSAVFGSSGGQDAHDLKRKASAEEDDVEEGPSRKSAHGSDAAGAAGVKKSGSSRRKSTGNPQQDESRLLKRKEQNRAAQRAFRERKEKHVRDLEDKVAALEAKNALAVSENENLRDLLQRLQSENMQLKQAAFTFNMPSSSSQPKPNPQPLYAALRDYTFNFSSPPTSDAIDFNGLTTFDPAAMDEQTATATDVRMDMGYDSMVGGPAHMRSPYRTIVSNPLFMSFAEPGPESQPQQQQQGFSFPASPPPAAPTQAKGAFEGFNQFLPWPGSIPSPSHASSSGSQNGGGGGSSQDSAMQSFDELFGGNFLGATGPVDFAALVSRGGADAMSPVSHTNANANANDSQSSSSSSSSPLTPTQSAASSTPALNISCGMPGAEGADGCPKTRQELSKHIAEQGASPFVSAGGVPVQPFPVLRKQAGGDGGEEMVVCKGSNIPRTEASERNVEVLAAWRSITSNPKFKFGGGQDIDINELCSEFTKKAKCDGTKVVLEPSGVQCILDTLHAKKQQQQQ